MQDRKQSVTIPLPNLGVSRLCPIKALNNMIHLFPDTTNDPLFVLPRPSISVPLTDSVARKHLKKISTSLGLNQLTFNYFPCLPCLSGSTTSLVLLGVRVNFDLKIIECHI